MNWFPLCCLVCRKASTSSSTVIESSAVELSVEPVATQLLNAENRLESHVDAHAVLRGGKRKENGSGRVQFSRKIICFRCGQRGHIKRDCPQSKGNGSSQAPVMHTGLGTF
jgi:hypothetical protein